MNFTSATARDRSAVNLEVKKVTISSMIAVVIGLTAYALAEWRMVIDKNDGKIERPANLESLSPLDAHGVVEYPRDYKVRAVQAISPNPNLSKDT